MKDDEFLKKWIKDWNKIEGIKPSNDPEFIKKFIEWIERIPGDHWSFTGENGYCGCTATVTECFNGYSISPLDFEFAYSGKSPKPFVKVFTLHHSGFWTPEYISLSGVESKEILGILSKKLLEYADF